MHKSCDKLFPQSQENFKDEITRMSFLRCNLLMTIYCGVDICIESFADNMHIYYKYTNVDKDINVDKYINGHVNNC